MSGKLFGILGCQMALQATIARLPLLGYFMFLQPENFSPTANRCKCIKQKLNKELQARTEAQQ